MKTATILAIMALVMPATGASLSYVYQRVSDTHNSNEIGYTENRRAFVAADGMNDFIVKKQRLCDKIKSEIKSMKNQKLDIILSPQRNDPEVLREKSRIENEIKDLEQLFRREQKLLDDERLLKRELIKHLAIL